MSENETKGRFRREFESYYADKHVIPNRSEWILADGIDRIAADLAAVNRSVREELDGIAADVRAMNPSVRKELDRIAADVAAVKEATLPQTTSVHCNFACPFMEERDAANREREEAIRERENANRERDEARADVKKLSAVRTGAIYERDVAIRERDKARKERDEAGAKFRRLLGELAEARAEVERLRAELAAARAETQRIQDEADDREQTEKVKRLNAEIEKTHRTLLNRTWERDQFGAEVERLRGELAARPPAGWLTEEERQILANLLLYQWGNLGWPARVVPALNAILARAGSPPVVVLPTVFQHSSLGDKLVALQQVRDALDKAGVPWIGGGA